jgi:hypothetical protein
MPFSLSPHRDGVRPGRAASAVRREAAARPGSGLGKGIREFKRSIKDVNDEIQRPDDTNRIQDPVNRPQVSQTRDEAEVRRDP